MLLKNYPLPDSGKTIIRTRFVQKLQIHFHHLKKHKKTYDGNFNVYNFKNTYSENKLIRDNIVINHYSCKSWAEWLQRSKRGDAMYKWNKLDKKNFESRDTNLVYDNFIVKFVKKLKFRKNKKTPQPVEPVEMFKWSESELAHKFLDGLNGCEIGASPENPFNIRSAAYCNIDIPVQDRESHNAYFHDGFAVNIIADGADLPFKNDTMDYVLASHVIEHFFDPIAAIEEWLRVIRPGGYVFMVVPHKNRIYDILRPTTTVSELTDRHEGKLTRENYIVRADPEYEKLSQSGAAHTLPDFIKISDTVPDGFIRLDNDPRHHLSVWDYDNMLELCRARGWKVKYSVDTDDKLGNGFVFILTK